MGRRKVGGLGGGGGSGGGMKKITQNELKD